MHLAPDPWILFSTNQWQEIGRGWEHWVLFVNYMRRCRCPFFEMQVIEVTYIDGFNWRKLILSTVGRRWVVLFTRFISLLLCYINFKAFLVNMGYVLVLFPLQEALVQEMFWTRIKLCGANQPTSMNSDTLTLVAAGRVLCFSVNRCWYFYAAVLL